LTCNFNNHRQENSVIQ